MSQIRSPSLARCYGKARVAQVWRISRASVYRSLEETPPNTIAGRPGPVGACSATSQHPADEAGRRSVRNRGARQKDRARVRPAGIGRSDFQRRRICTIMWTWGWWVIADPQVCKTERIPMRAPRCLGSAAMVSMVSAEALNRMP
jgi:hypothetical protein